MKSNKDYCTKHQLFHGNKYPSCSPKPLESDTFKKNYDWEKKFHSKFTWDLTGSMEEDIKQFIKSNFISNNELREKFIDMVASDPNKVIILTLEDALKLLD